MADAEAVLVTGATGLIGRRLVAELLRTGSRVRALSRDPGAAARGSSAVEWTGWDGRKPEPAALEGCGAMVHLAGEPVFAGRLSARRRARILESRVDSTRGLLDACRALSPGKRPAVFACASAVGYYGSRGEEILDETSAPGSGFLAEVCRAWEEAAAAAEALGLRRVSLRFGIALGRDGGALAQMATLFRTGLGGRLGSGRQWVPWIHADDAARLLAASLRDPTLRGPVNAVSPQPVRNADLTRALARALRRPALIPAPAHILRLALGELAEELLASRRVVPTRAQESGFDFAYPALESALEEELDR